MLSLLFIAVGSFAIGTEAFMLAGILPGIAGDLGVSISVAGQLVTVFSLTYALGSPLVAVATGGMDRKRLLMASMAAFAAGNLLAATSHGYAGLLAVRILMALAAGTYMPAASAYAAAVAAPEKRGRALSIIYVGLTLATVVGAPLGVLVGGRFGWRVTFAGVSVLALGAVAGIWREVQPVAGLRAASLSERLSVARRRDVLGALGLTALALTGTFTLYTYLAPFLARTVGMVGPALAGCMFVFGAGGALGNLVGGWAADRVSAGRLQSIILTALAVIFALLSLSGRFLPPGPGAAVAVTLIVLWGVVGWAFPSIQQTRLVRLDPGLASITLSLNASATYLGISLGAVLGSLAMARGGVLTLGWLAGACEVIGLLLLRRVPESAPTPGAAAEPAAVVRGMEG